MPLSFAGRVWSRTIVFATRQVSAATGTGTGDQDGKGAKKRLSELVAACPVMTFSRA